MKYLLVVEAVLLALAINVLAVPIDASSDNHCLRGQCVYVGDGVSAESHVIQENDIASGAVTAEHIVNNKGIVEAASSAPLVNSIKGKQRSRTVDMWERRTTRCRRGPSDEPLTAQEEQEKSGAPQDPDALCTGTLEGRCVNGTLGLGNKVETDMLVNRLLPQPLKFPTGISADDWTAMQAALALLDGHIASQADLHRVCIGAEDPQAFGFKLDVFRRFCTPEITLPAPKSEIVEAHRKILSALYIDTILERNNNDFRAACDEVRSPDTPDRGLDWEWIQFVLCSKAP